MELVKLEFHIPRLISLPMLILYAHGLAPRLDCARCQAQAAIIAAINIPIARKARMRGGEPVGDVFPPLELPFDDCVGCCDMDYGQGIQEMTNSFYGIIICGTPDHCLITLC
jgi:hypothetical protein